MDTQKYKVSIIVPIYNVENYLERCIKSLISQTYKNIEIILVNDGSPDSCYKICEKYKDLDDRIIYLKKENGGLSSARNFGMKYMTGDYVWFVDSDDYISIDAVETLIGHISDKDIDILAFNYFSVKDNNVNEIRFKYDSVSIEKERRFMLELPMAWGKIYKSCIFKDNDLKFKEGIVYEDLALIPGLINYTKKIDFFEKPLYYYQIREGSIMRKDTFNNKIDNKFVALENLSNMFIKNNSITLYKDEIEFLHIKHLLIVYSMEIMKFGSKIYKKRLCKALDVINNEFPNWTKNKYLKMEPIYTRMYTRFLKNKMFIVASLMNFIARKVLV